MISLEIITVCLLVALNGAFAVSELAIMYRAGRGSGSSPRIAMIVRALSLVADTAG